MPLNPAPTEYTLQVNGTAGASNWISRTFAYTDADAIKQAQCAALEFAGVHWFMSLSVWKPGGVKPGEMNLVAQITLAKPTAVVS